LKGPRNPAVEREISIEQNPAILRAADARVAGDLALARRRVDGVLRAEPGSVDAWTESWEIALQAGDGERSGLAGLRLLELHRRGSDPDTPGRETPGRRSRSTGGRPRRPRRATWSG
jgi:hypothetical protein